MFKKTAGEFIFNVGKKVVQKLSGQGKTTGKEVFDKVNPKVSTKKSRSEIDSKKAKSKFKGAIDSVNSDIYETGAALRRMGQKLDNKKITKSGFNKAKDLRNKKMGGGMMGRRFGYKGGSKGLVGKQKNIDVAAPFGTINEKDFSVLRERKK